VEICFLTGCGRLRVPCEVVLTQIYRVEEYTMLEFGIRIKCSRCGMEDEFFKHYERRYESEIINQMRHHFFASFNSEGKKWREKSLDDLQHLCPKCDEGLQKLNREHQSKVNEWIKEAENEVV
jgi:ribosomal protein S27AE